jgi:hypothetical protein
MSRVVIFNVQTAPKGEESPFSFDRIIEVSLQVYDNGKYNKSESMIQLFNPEAPLSEKAKQLHAHTDKELKSKPLIGAYLDKIASTLGSADHLVMHFSHFHKQAMLNEFKHAGKDFAFDKDKIFDIFSKVQQYFGKENYSAKGSRTLEKLYEEFEGFMRCTRQGDLHAAKKTTKLEGTLVGLMQRIIEDHALYAKLISEKIMSETDKALFKSMGLTPKANLQKIKPTSETEQDFRRADDKHPNALSDAELRQRGSSREEITGLSRAASQHGVFKSDPRLTRSRARVLLEQDSATQTAVKPK